METEFSLNALNVTVEIEYNIWAAEAEQRYGDSPQPGSPAEIEILDVCVTSVSGATYDLNSEELLKHSWAQELNRLAFYHAVALVEEDGWLADHIADDAAADEENW